MSLTRLILRFAAPVPHPEQFDRVLMIGPHPDDIEIGAGATAAKLAAQGKKICMLICTDGRFGTANAPSGISGDELAALRMEEARASARVLGVTDVRFLGLRDGAGYTEDELLRGIAQTVADFQPEILFAPDPFVRGESHADHLRVGQAARQIACFAPYDGIMQTYGAAAAQVKAVAYYMTASPNRYVATRKTMDQQMQAIFDCHLSQYPKDCADANAIRTYLKLRSIDFGIRSLRGCAEGFRVQGALHMHCLPEA